MQEAEGPQAVYCAMNQIENNKEVQISVQDGAVTSAGTTVDPPKMLFPISDRTRDWLEWLDNTIAMQVALVLLCLADLVLLIIALADDSHHRDTVTGLTITVLVLLTLEVCIRLVFLDVIRFFTDPWCVFDAVVCILSIICEAVLSRYGRFVVIARLIRMCRMMCNGWRQHRTLKKTARKVVSQNRRRYVKDGFDLDITYITNRVLAMSVPAVGKESLYRNPVNEVARFFHTKHPAHFRIFNLCPERFYPYSKFGQDSVEECFMGDHNPAPLSQMLHFCEQAHTFLQQDPTNVIAVHCKGGKGRTGTMICSYLLYSGVCSKADEALELFANQRTSESGQREGVEAKSQERFVHYLATLLKPSPHLPPSVTLSLKFIRVHAVAPIAEKPSYLWFVVYQGFCHSIYDHSAEVADRKDSIIVDNQGFADFFPSRRVDLTNDIRLAFYRPKVKKNKGTKKKKHAVASSSADAENSYVEPSVIDSQRQMMMEEEDDEDDESGNQNDDEEEEDEEEEQKTAGPEGVCITIPEEEKFDTRAPTRSVVLNTIKNSGADAAEVARENEMKLKSKKKKKSKRQKPVFQCWLHTSFVKDKHFSLPRNEIDGVRKIKGYGTFTQNFRLEVFFD